MASRRVLKAAEAIREVVSMAILTEIRDPRVEHVTVTSVEVAPDMRNAKVLVSIMGDEGRQHLCLRGLQNSAGFLQSKIAKRIDTRYTPRLTFEIDEGIKKSLEVAQILRDLELEREQRRAAAELANLEAASDDHTHAEAASSSAEHVTEQATEPESAPSQIDDQHSGKNATHE